MAEFNKAWIIYGLCEPETLEVRYVGFTSQGQKKRMKEHNKDVRDGERSYKANWMRSLWAKGLKPAMTVLEEGFGPGWQECEAKWIAHYRSLNDRLTNFSDGGDGCPGVQHTEETKAKMSVAAKASWIGRDDRRAITSESSKRQWEDPDRRIKHSELMSGLYSDQEWKTFWLEKMREAKNTEEARANISNAVTESYNTKPELRKTRSEWAKKQWEDPEYVAKVMAGLSSQKHRESTSAVQKRLWSNPEYRERVLAATHKPWSEERKKSTSEKAKQRWMDPEFKAKMAARLKARWEDPEYRAKMASMKDEKTGKFKKKDASATEISD